MMEGKSAGCNIGCTKNAMEKTHWSNGLSRTGEYKSNNRHMLTTTLVFILADRVCRDVIAYIV